jgi:hypothetical protein
MVHNAYSKTRRIPNQEIIQELQTGSVLEKISTYEQNRKQHINRMEQERLPGQYYIADQWDEQLRKDQIYAGAEVRNKFMDMILRRR